MHIAAVKALRIYYNWRKADSLVDVHDITRLHGVDIYRVTFFPTLVYIVTMTKKGTSHTTL